jgi:hypothetical protein
MKKLMKWSLIIDGRNIWNRTIVEEYGFEYVTIG